MRTFSSLIATLFIFTCLGCSRTPAKPEVASKPPASAAAPQTTWAEGLAGFLKSQEELKKKQAAEAASQGETKPAVETKTAPEKTTSQTQEKIIA